MQGISGNRSFYSNNQIDSLLGLARTTTNIKERVFFYNQIESLIAKDFPVIPLYFDKFIVGLSKNIKNFKIRESGNHIFTEIKLNKEDDNI